VLFRYCFSQFCVVKRSRETVSVQVYVANLTFDLGYLEYAASLPGRGLSVTELIIIGVVVGAAAIIILIVIVVVVVKLKRKSTAQERALRRLQRQYTALEHSVRDGCKQGLISSLQ